MKLKFRYVAYTLSLGFVIGLIFITVFSFYKNQESFLSKEFPGIKKVQDYFEDDKLKTKAAKFYISNLDINNSEKQVMLQPSDNFHAVIDSLFHIYDLNFPSKSKKKITNLLSQKVNSEKPGPLINDQISSETIIESINLAFHTWKTKPWSKKSTFNEFCDYILTEQLIYPRWEKARSFFQQKYSNLPDSINNQDNCYIVAKYIEDDFDNWYTGRWGDCFHEGILRTIALRSMGVPTSFESIPQWGNMNVGHNFYTIHDRKHDTITHLIDNSNLPRNTKHIISGSYFDNDISELIKLVNSNCDISYCKTIPKVYRVSPIPQDNSLACLNSDLETIPTYFRNNKLEDVTNHYLETADIKIKLNLKTKSKFAYLCVFNTSGWNPVAWSKIRKGKVQFKQLGKNIVYLPAIYDRGKIIPVGVPFILQNDGATFKLEASGSMQSMKLYRKYFLTTHDVKNAAECLFTKFQVANKDDLSDAETIYTIDSIFFEPKEIEVNCKSRYRYLIYDFKNNQKTSLAELGFNGQQRNNEECKLFDGQIIGNKGLKKFTTENLIDDKTLTFYKSDPYCSLLFIGFDFGITDKVKINKIKFCPRNDRNNVIPNLDYELFYWDYEWKSLGIKKSNNNFIIYDNVPAGALYWLRCLSEGKEERIFTYENGKQVWW